MAKGSEFQNLNLSWVLKNLKEIFVSGSEATELNSSGGTPRGDGVVSPIPTAPHKTVRRSLIEASLEALEAGV